MPKPGDRALDFTLQSTVGEINLRLHLDGKKMVLGFYIEDNTPG